MRIVKKPSSKVNANTNPRMNRRRIRAAEENVAPDTQVHEDDVDQVVDVTPEATDLLFETEDVAQLLAEVTDSEVAVDVDEDTDQITFTVDDVPYVVEPEGDEEVLEATRRPLKGKKSVKASSRPTRRIRGAKRFN